MAVGEGLGRLVGSQNQPREAVFRLRCERGKADRLEQTRSLPQSTRIVDDASPLVEPPGAGKREAGRFGREAGKADKAEPLGHSSIRAIIVSASALHARKRVILQRGRKDGGAEAGRSFRMRNSMDGEHANPIAGGEREPFGIEAWTLPGTCAGRLRNRELPPASDDFL